MRIEEMYAGNTLFVVGAGASFELGFPLGATLKGAIARCLHVDQNSERLSEYGHSHKIPFLFPGDKEIYRFIYGKSVPYFDTMFHNDARALVQQQMNIWRQLGEGVHFAASIDNYLHNRRENNDIVQVGKAAIAWVIAKEEEKLARRAPRDWLTKGEPDYAKKDQPPPAWTMHFAEQCFSLVEWKDDLKQIETALSRTRFIVFNYDRCVEQFISIALQGLFAMDKDAAEACAGEVEIVHPYGDLGPLAQEPFGKHPPSPSTKGQIKTFTEGLRSLEDKQRLAASIGWADTIVFLGFGFIAQNMKLLEHPAKKGVHVLGTSLGLSENAEKSAKLAIGKAFGIKGSAADLAAITLKRLTCAELLAENTPNLVAAD